MRTSRRKIRSRVEIKKVLSAQRKIHKKIVFTNGCFDILHRGHIELLEKAKSFGDILVVAVNSDESVKKIKDATRPLNKLEDRLIVLSSLETVDYVTSFSETDPAKTIEELKPDILVKGGDWKTDEVIGKNTVESYGGKVEIIPYVEGYSTTSLIEKLK